MKEYKGFWALKIHVIDLEKRNRALTERVTELEEWRKRLIPTLESMRNTIASGLDVWCTRGMTELKKPHGEVDVTEGHD